MQKLPDLSLEQRLANKQRFIEILSELNIDLTAILHYLESDRVDFFNKPYDLFTYNYAGSLCDRALKVYDCLMRQTTVYLNNYNKNELIIITLLKDIYRAELYESYTKNIKNDTVNQWEAILDFRTKDIRPVFGDLGFSSYMIIKKFIPNLSDEAIEAIIFAGNCSINPDLYKIKQYYPLVSIISIVEQTVDYIERNSVCN